MAHVNFRDTNLIDKHNVNKHFQLDDDDAEQQVQLGNTRERSTCATCLSH